jgi:L-ascorbate metabolism protein UlaG (beta-lactamase superfamily)
MSDTRFTHIGGPTALIEFGGWRILTDPTFDPPGQRYFFGWGTTSRKLVGPSIDAADLGRIDAVLVSHHHHGDNLDPRPGAAADLGHDLYDKEGRGQARGRLRRPGPLGDRHSGGAG